MGSNSRELYREIMQDREAVTTILQAGTPEEVWACRQHK